MNMSNTITVRVNGKARQVRDRSSLFDLLEHLELNPGAVVVELNREVVRQPALRDKYLQDGDNVELVHFVGGG